MCVFLRSLQKVKPLDFVCILSIEDELDDQEFKIAKIASDFLGKQLEA